MIYGRELFEQFGTTLDRRMKFRVSSTDWHRFLGFDSALKSLERGVLGLGITIMAKDSILRTTSLLAGKNNAINIYSAQLAYINIRGYHHGRRCPIPECRLQERF